MTLGITIILTLAMIVAYWLYTKPTIREKQIKQEGGNFPCFQCKKELNMSYDKCPNCELITLFGATKKKKKQFFIIVILYVFALAKMWRNNNGFF